MYGYTDEKVVGLKRWYTDYMQCQVMAADTSRIGVPQEIYSIKPATPADFEYTYELDALKEPQNVIEEIKSIIKRIEKLFANREEIEIGWSV